MMDLPREIKNKAKGDFEDRIEWTEFRGQKKAKHFEGKIKERLPDGCYRVERVEFIQKITEHIVHFEKVDRITR